ncbi:hypothetical protein CFP65_1829 [Kitasatospora sp. MMS16-BH015]|uniref:WXG100-like domain-containing protein n=1 Tax=Kitasatospora sp. MMS16-BH015 TaxID=2018025 RepID=UPI000CA2819A|nr:toxin glutamine deamidase domain-containing protein [Kitasatospora sp. MMS16-BH015]AUG76703.1 hypothetical protein CFP65_1829 [Kitasatospora sp. MMS16-BH015]
MATELPEPLQWVLLLLAGCRWPEADEGELRDMAERWRSAGKELEQASQAADTAVKNALDGQQGQAAEGLTAYWAKYTTGDQAYLPGTVKACEGMGDMLESMANSAETAKIQIIAQLGILAFEIATAEAEAPFTAGASLLEIPAAIAIGRTAVQAILKTLLKEALEHAIKMGVQMGAINLMAQGIEVAEGHRKSIDMKELGQSALGGAVSGAIGNQLGKELGGIGGKVLPKGAMESLPGKMVHGAATGVGTDALTQLATTGTVDPNSLLGSGLSGGAGVGLHAGANAAREHFNGPPKFAPPHGIGDSAAPAGEGGAHPSGTGISGIGDPLPSGSGGRQDGPPSSTGTGDNSTYHGPEGSSGAGEGSARPSLAPFGSDRPSGSVGGEGIGRPSGSSGSSGSGESSGRPAAGEPTPHLDETAPPTGQQPRPVAESPVAEHPVAESPRVEPQIGEGTTPRIPAETPVTARVGEDAAPHVTAETPVTDRVGTQEQPRTESGEHVQEPTAGPRPVESVRPQEPEGGPTPNTGPAHEVPADAPFRGETQPRTPEEPVRSVPAEPVRETPIGASLPDGTSHSVPPMRETPVEPALHEVPSHPVESVPPMRETPVEPTLHEATPRPVDLHEVRSEPITAQPLRETPVEPTLHEAAPRPVDLHEVRSEPITAQPLRETPVEPTLHEAAPRPVDLHEVRSEPITAQPAHETPIGASLPDGTSHSVPPMRETPVEPTVHDVPSRPAEPAPHEVSREVPSVPVAGEPVRVAAGEAQPHEMGGASGAVYEPASHDSGTSGGAASHATPNLNIPGGAPHLNVGSGTTHIDGGTRVSSAPPRAAGAPDSVPTPDHTVPNGAEPQAPAPAAMAVPPQFGPVHGSGGGVGVSSNRPGARPEGGGPRPESSVPPQRTAGPRPETHTEPGTGSGGSSNRFRTQEQRQRQLEQEQRRHEFATREHTTPDRPVEPRRDLPGMGREERLHTIGNLKPEERRTLAADKEFVAELRRSSTPEEFAESAAHLLVEVDPRAVQSGAARHEAQQQLARMLRDPEVAERLLTNGVEVVVVPKHVRMTDTEAFEQYQGRTAGGEAGGGRSVDDFRGATANKKVAITEENLLGEKTSIGDDPNHVDGYSTTTHELAHAIQKYGLSEQQKQGVLDAFNQKKTSLDADPEHPAQWPDGTRPHTEGGGRQENYSSTDHEEYFAQATNAYLSTNHGTDPLTGQDRNNGAHWTGEHEQALRPLLEQLYGKDPQAVYTGGRANPVDHIEAVSGLGEFFRQAEGGTPETPTPHQDTPHTETPQPHAETPHTESPAPHGDDLSPAPAVASTSTSAAPATGEYSHKIDGKKAADSIEKFLGDSAKSKDEFAKLRPEIEKYDRADLEDGDTAAMLGSYRQQKRQHVDVLSRNEKELADRAAGLRDESGRLESDLGKPGITPEERLALQTRKEQVDSTLGRIQGQQDRMAIFEHEYLKQTKPTSPELPALQRARQEAEVRVLPDAIAHIKAQEARVAELRTTADDRVKAASKDQAKVFQSHADDLKLRAEELKTAREQREKDLAAAEQALKSPPPAKPAGPREGGVPEPTGKTSAQDWKKLNDSYRKAFGYSEHGVMSEQPHAEKLVLRSDKKPELAAARINRNHVIADYMVHKYVTAAVLKARSLDPEAHRAASEAFGDFVTDMAPDRHRIYDRLGSEAEKRLAAGGHEEAELVRRDLAADKDTVDLGATYGPAVGKAFDPAGVGDHKSAVETRAELERQLGRSGLDTVAKPELAELAKAVDGVHPTAPRPEQIAAVHEALGKVQQKVKKQAVEDLALVNGVTGPKLLDDAAATLTAGGGTAGLRTPAARERLAGQLDSLAGRYEKAGAQGKPLRDLAADLRSGQPKATPDQLRQLGEQLPGDRAKLREAEVKQRLAEVAKPTGADRKVEAAANDLDKAKKVETKRQKELNEGPKAVTDAEKAYDAAKQKAEASAQAAKTDQTKKAEAAADAKARTKAGEKLTAARKKLEEAPAKLAEAKRDVAAAEVVRKRVEEVHQEQIKAGKDDKSAARVAWAVADHELVGRQYGGAYARAGAGENHPAGMFEHALTAKVEDVPALIEDITAKLSNSESNLRFGDETVNKWVQNFLDPHLVRDPEVVNAVAHGQLPGEALYSSHTADLLTAVHSLEANGLVPKDLREIMAPKTQGDLTNVLSSADKDPSPSARNIGDELHVEDDRTPALPVSSSGEFANRPAGMPGPLPAGHEALPKPIRDVRTDAVPKRDRTDMDSDGDVQMASPPPSAEPPVKRRQPGSQDMEIDDLSPAPSASRSRGFGTVTPHEEQAPHEQQTSHQQQTPHEQQEQPAHDHDQQQHDQQHDDPMQHGDEEHAPAPEILLPPEGTVERMMVEDPVDLLMNQHVPVSADFTSGAMQRMPGLAKHQANAFVAAVDNSGQHWFALVPDRQNIVPGKNGFVLTPAWEKYVEHDQNFPRPPAGVELPPVQPDHHYVTGSYVPYKYGAPDPRVEGSIGKVTVPLHPDPSRPGEGLVMTGGMNGCAYAITDVTPHDFTVWHFQSYSASSHLQHTTEFQTTRPVSDWFGVDEYMTHGQPDLYRVTNILKHGPDGWEVVSHEVVEQPGNHHPARVNRRPLNLDPPTEADRVRMSSGTYGVTAREQLQFFDRQAQELVKNLNTDHPAFPMLRDELTGLRDRLAGQVDRVTELQQPGRTLQDVRATADRLAAEAPGHQQAVEGSKAFIEGTMRTIMGEPMGRDNKPFSEQGKIDNLAVLFDPSRGGHWIDRMRADSEKQIAAQQRVDAGQGFGSVSGLPHDDLSPAPPAAARHTPASGPAEHAPVEHPPTEHVPGERSERKRSRDEEEDENGYGDRYADHGEPAEKRRRTPAYENTSAVMQDRGYQSFGKDHPLTRELEGYLGEPGRLHPPMSNSLLQKVNPHAAPVHPGERFRPGSDLNACLENVEAYRDTHFGRARVSGQTLHGTVEEIPGNTLWKRHDGPALFGEGPDAVRQLMDKVRAGGPGTFATVLGTGAKGDGHAVALVHDRDGTLRWADLTDRRVSTADPTAMPAHFGEDWTVWASVADPQEHNISGPHDPEFMDRYSSFRRPADDGPAHPDQDGFGTAHTNPEGHSAASTFPRQAQPPKPEKSWAAYLPTDARAERDAEKGARRQANEAHGRAVESLEGWMKFHADQHRGVQGADGVWRLGPDPAHPEVSYDPGTGRFTSRLDPTTLNDRYAGVVSAARDVTRHGLRSQGDTSMVAHDGLKPGDFLAEYGRANPETRDYWASQDTRVQEIDRFADELAAENRPLLDPAAVEALLPEDQEAHQQAGNVLAQHDGFVLGETHSDPQTWSFLTGQMGQLRDSGVRTLYLEHFRDDALQADVTAFMGGAEPSPQLTQALTRYNDRWHVGNDAILNTLTAAREHGVDVQLIDGFPARKPDGPMRAPDQVNPEAYERARRMNAYAVEAIRERQAELPDDAKYLVVVGSAHVGQHAAPSGRPAAPGIAESLGLPGLGFRRQGDGSSQEPVADPLRFRQIPPRPTA